MAHLEFYVKKFDDTGLQLSVEAFSDKILSFTASLIDIILSCATDGGIEKSLIANSLERQHRKFKNFNLDVIVRCNNSRLQYLMPDHFHPCQMEKALKDSWLRYGADGEAASEASEGPEMMSPSTFLRERILNRIQGIQVLVVGNTSESEALAFC